MSANHDERICPTCLRPYKTEHPERRICSECKRPILRHEKFRFVKSQVRHRDCNDPTIYPKAAA